jgi:alpha-L-arabinofuranosidase
MKSIVSNILIILIVFLLVNSCSSINDVYPDLCLKVSTDQFDEAPVSDLLYSHFIEIGFGYQIAPMQAELFFNRSFEPFPAYNGKSKNSFGLFTGGGDYLRDWSGEAWYHSGYEHNSWYVAPGIPGNPAWITDSSDYFIRKTDNADVILETISGGCGHGRQYIRIKNNEKDRWAGIAQDGKWMESGYTYFFSGYLRQKADGKRQQVGNKENDKGIKVLMFNEGEWEDSLYVKEIIIDDEFKQYGIEIPFEGPTGRVTFALFIPPGSTVEADCFSLLPEDHFFKWKPATVDAVKKLNPGLIRFPGGCFASFYDWKKGVGQYDERAPEPSYFWGGLNNNDLGTAEFAMLCRDVGCEMMLCVNMFHPNKENYLNSERNPWQYIDYSLPQFSDIEKGIENACEWLAYCNLREGEHPMADLRVSHGFREPFGVKYWEMDNETVRWMDAAEYAELCVRYSMAMKTLDPDIRIGMITYDFTEKVPEMLKIAGKNIDFLADRDDFEDGRLDRMISLLNDYNAANGTNIKYCNTEWQVHPYGAPNPKEEVDERYLYGHKTSIKRSMVLGTWYCGLKAAGYLMDWQRYGSKVDFVNFNNFSNTHGQAVLETPKEGAYLTAPGKIYEIMSRTPAKWPLKCYAYFPQRTDMLQAQASLSLDKDSLVLYGLNRTDSAKLIRFDLTDIKHEFKKIDFVMLDADDIFARTKIDIPDEIRRTEWGKKFRGNILKMECPPRSFVHAVVSNQ